MQHANRTVWQRQWPSETALSAQARTLLAEQSLTRALKSLNAVFSVRLLHSGLGEAGGFWQGLSAQPEYAFTREVYLCLDGEAVVWARSVCPPESAFWRGLLDCGTQPLGERLFDGSLDLARSPLEFASLPLSGQAEASAFQTAFAARRSVFAHETGGTLALVECFLPALQKFLP